METVAIMMIGIYLLLILLILFFWYQFNQMKKCFWKNRHIEVKEKITPIDLTPRPSAHGLRYKPKHRTDEKLFEIEQNPGKQ